MNMYRLRSRCVWVFLMTLFSLQGCGGSSYGDSDDGSGSSYTVGGSVSGLTGSGLVLQNNGGNDLNITANGAFTFTTAIAYGATYSATIKTQPADPPQVCTLSNGSGTMGSAAVTNVTVTCAAAVAKFLYVPNTGSSNISIFSVNAATGALTEVPGSPLAMAESPLVAQVDPSRKFLYVTPYNLSSLYGFSINAATGELTELMHSPFFLGNFYLGYMDFHPSKHYGYGLALSSGGIFGVSFDPTTGDLNMIPGAPYSVDTGSPASVGFGVFNSTGSLYYVPFGFGGSGTPGSIKTFSVDATTGALSNGAPTVVTGGDNPAVMLSPSGQLLYAINTYSGTVSSFTVDSTTGALTAVSGSPFATGNGRANNLLVHPVKDFLYMTTQSGLTATAVSVVGYSVEPDTGVLTPLAGSPFATGAVTTNDQPIGLALLHPSGKFLYVMGAGTNGIFAFEIDQSTGSLSEIAGSPFETGSTPTGKIDPSGKYFYVIDYGSNDVRSYAIDPTTGSLTPVTTAPTGTHPLTFEMARL